jgi:hypothetical protein
MIHSAGLQHHKRRPSAVLGVPLSDSDRVGVPRTIHPPPLLAPLLRGLATPAPHPPPLPTPHSEANLHPHEGGARWDTPLLQLQESSERIRVFPSRHHEGGTPANSDIFLSPQKTIEILKVV